ncbi:hypothetical protein D9758_006146 [Tetrapyrgos nigripes]|uniref:Uncharacterized protein n=1 Tax=Tetrapyrgos nigripes TaxID=182062 RepID=A0A8H5LLA3_9AGAR|nr:hypothetical protein D9758_006146 [Tetrapyrgos nigripes]
MPPADLSSYQRPRGEIRVPSPLLSELDTVGFVALVQARSGIFAERVAGLISRCLRDWIARSPTQVFSFSVLVRAVTSYIDAGRVIELVAMLLWYQQVLNFCYRHR